VAGKVEVKEGYALVNGEVVPLISGEVHYWRVQRANWRPILEKVRELGLDVVATYVCWDFHELAAGEYDFTGKTAPERDFVGFLEMTREMGFKLMLRPGPYIYSEWPLGGPPERASKFHRLHPEFKELGREWIRAVSEVIAPFQATAGGHVIALQPDNEPYPAIQSQGTEMGCFGEPGLFKEWLAERYANDIDALNAAWRANYASFNDADIHWEEPYVNRIDIPENGRLMPEARYEQRVIDSQEWVEWYACEIVRWTGEAYRECGIDVPFFSNGWHVYAQNFHITKEVAPLCGVDLYPSRFFECSNTMPGGNDWDYNMEILKVQENNVGWGYSAELSSGIWEGGWGHGEYTPESTAFMNRSLIANGLKGWNWYMIVNRDNWYHSPINQFGRETMYFGAHKAVIDLAKKIELHTLHRAPAVSLVTLRRQRLTDSGNWQTLWNSLTSAGIDFETVDCQYESPTRDLILYGGTNLIERDEAENLAKAVEAGATLVIFNRIPRENRLGEEVNPFGLPEPDAERPIGSPFSVSWDGGTGEMPRGGHLGRFWTLYFDSTPEGATPILAAPRSANVEALVDIRATDLAANTYRMGFVKPFGRGKVIVLGVSPSPQAVHLAREIAGGTVKIETKTPGTAVTFWEREDAEFVFVINRNTQTCGIELSLDPAVYPNASALVNVETGSSWAVEPSGRAFISVGGHVVDVFKVTSEEL
jgi:hypothetical protein